jgi:hypothetical protein
MSDVPSLWPGHYLSAVPIRGQHDLYFFTARSRDTDRLCLIAMAPRMPLGEARARLAGLARAHRLVAGDHVPGVVEEDLTGANPWVALECDAVADLDSLRGHIRATGDRPDLARATAISKTIMETLRRCHSVRDPLDGRPMCLGSLAAGNILFGPTGHLWLVGFGAGPLGDAFIAPEVATGAAPTPGADVYALTLFLRAQLEFVRLPSVAQRVFAGRSLTRDAYFVGLFVWSNRRILAELPSMRPDMDTALARATQLWRGLGFFPDVDGFASWATRAIAAERAEATNPRGGGDEPGLTWLRSLASVRSPTRDEQPILLSRDGEWFETSDGVRRPLGSHRALRRIFLALANAQKDGAGSALSAEELVRVGWPGENPVPEAGLNRLRVAISTLRKLGLGDVVQRWDGGYRLDPSVPCRFNNC